MMRKRRRPSLRKKRGHLPLPSVVMSRSGGHHSDEYHDHLILNSSDEEESDDHSHHTDRMTEKMKDIDKEDNFPTTKESMHNPYQKDGEHVYEDTN